MQSARPLVKCSIRQWRSFSSCCVLRGSSQPQAQTQTQKSQNKELPPVPLMSVTDTPLEIPQPEGGLKKFSPKIESIVNEITKLNLVEVGELSDLLKKRLNLPDTPIMPMGGFAPAAAEEEEEPEAAKKVQTSFTVKLLKFDEKQKIALIKEVKSLLEGMNLVQAKKFVESAPTVVKADLAKNEAEQLKEALCKVGAECTIE